MKTSFHFQDLPFELGEMSCTLLELETHLQGDWVRLWVSVSLIYYDLHDA